MRAGLKGVLLGLDKFWQIWAKVGKGRQVWMGQTDQARMVMGSGWAWVCEQV